MRGGESHGSRPSALQMQAIGRDGVTDESSCVRFLEKFKYVAWPHGIVMAPCQLFGIKYVTCVATYTIRTRYTACNGRQKRCVAHRLKCRRNSRNIEG